ncbi:hypothetical protein [Mesorhizobium australafricanum]|uniref:Uncharacterized protein n=1 Tax=Mesorhizobium australafricanum TaxID=3072311 RepID=A0ABU4WV42_9HYPH|nr:hypothetical protein [Mesorhizobium sp. VK3E]MDX8438684.1 hypothetical protein [Mesorhizobium sp. VK3E]
MSTLSISPRWRRVASHGRSGQLANARMEALSWGLFFRIAKKIAILTRRLF